MLLCRTYHPFSLNDDYYFYELGKSFDLLFSIYNRFILIGEFDAEESESCLTHFRNGRSLNNLVLEKHILKVTST